MFVWVMVGGLIDAAQQLEEAGAKLLQKSAQAAASIALNPASAHHSSSPSSMQQHRWQLPTVASKRVWTAIELMLLLPVLSNMFATLWASAKAVGPGVKRCCSYRQRQQPKSDLPVSSTDITASGSGSSSSRRWSLWLFMQQLFHPILADRALAAAFKLWLAMSILLAVTLLVADPQAGYTVWPLVSEAVRASPAAGIIGFVLAWHERVESTSIRVSG